MHDEASRAVESPPASGTAKDPYQLTPEGVKEPPTGWAQSVRYLGPGLLLSAAIVGSGELIATTALGAQAGFVLLWLVVVSTLIKVAVQVEFARWTISTGQPSLTGYNKVPPRLGTVSWVNLLWSLVALSKTLQHGGMVGGIAVALSVLAPIGGDPLGATSLAIWVTIVVLLSCVLLYSNRYAVLERGAFLLVTIFALITIAIAIGLPFTPLAYGSDDILRGLSFNIPAGAVGAAIAMFGLTGVSVDEISEYPYWCMEKGYAQWSGPADGSDAWLQRANGWIAVMYKDALVSWVVYTISTLAFFIMGAAVLHPQGLVPQGNQMITTLSRTYTDVLGQWANIVFLIGAIIVLSSTLWSAVPGWSRMWTNFLSTVKVLDWQNPRNRMRWIRGITIAQIILAGITYWFMQTPVLMVQIGGIMSSIFLLAAVWAIWYLRQTETDARLRGGGLFNTALIISSIAIAAVGLYSIVEVFGVTIG